MQNSNSLGTMLKVIVIGYAILLLLITPSSSATSLSKRGVIQLCGRRLAEALNMLCQGEYYDPEEDNSISKRNFEPGVRDDFYSGRLLGLLQLYSRKRRQEGGVVDECCRQACPLSVLLSYCRNGK